MARPGPPGTLASMQERERVLEAMLREAAAKGYEATTVGDVIARAGVSRQTFESMFAGKEACFLEAYDAAIDVLVARASAAFEGAAGEPWPDRVAAALRAMLELFAAEADIARMAIVEVTAIGEGARVRYRTALGRFVGFLEEGRDLSPRGEDLPAATAQFAIGAATALIFDEIRAGRGPELQRILPDLVFAVTMPYLGVEAAEAEMREVAGAG
jgi:AcrR family transcriptional regulator